MSVRVITAALDGSAAKLSARLVIFCLADAAHDDGISWEGNETIARKARLSLSEIKRSLKELEEMGEVEKRTAQVGRRRINVWRVNLPGVDDPRYERLPFRLAEPFSATAHIEPPSPDDGSSGASTTAHLAPQRARDPFKGPVTTDPCAAIAAFAREDWPPPVPEVHVDDDRANRPLNALAEECAIDGASRRLKLAAIHLNGIPAEKAPGGVAEPGIRDLFWIECVRYAEETDQQQRLATITPAEYAELLTAAIHRKAALYRQKMPDVTFGPKGLADHWLDLARAPTPGRPRAMSAEEFVRAGMDAA